MRLSGVDPGIIRELSGIYKPFLKAFKELVSNSYDADASTIDVVVADDFSAVEVVDDGIGMTPFHFQSDFARLGGSTAWQQEGRSPSGRPRIGYKGIGFLAVARYCSQLRVTSRSARVYDTRFTVRSGRATVELAPQLGDLVSAEHLRGRLHVAGVEIVPDGRASALRAGRDYDHEGTTIHLIRSRSQTT